MGAIKQEQINVDYVSERPKRSVSYINIPSFSLAIETLLDTSLKDYPLVLASPFIKNSRVQECSVEAKEAGISKGMLLSQAKIICDDLKIISPREELYRQISAKLESDIQKMVPLFERENKGKVFLDYTGMENLFGHSIDFHQRLREQIKYRYNLNADIGISCNKLVSKMAAKNLKSSCEKGVAFIPEKEAMNFLAPMPIEFLPLISEINQRQKIGRWDVLDDLNLMFIRDLQMLSRNHLEVAFGKIGHLLYDFSRGIDSRPVRPIELKKSIAFDHDFNEETNNCRIIFGIIHQLVDQCFQELFVQENCADSCCIYLRYTTNEFKKIELKSKNILQSKSNIQLELIKAMEKIGERRLAIKWIQVELTNVNKIGQQLSLFPTPQEKLNNQLMRIEQRFPGKVLNFSQKNKLIGGT